MTKPKFKLASYEKSVVTESSLSCFSYKSPGKPDGVNYVRTEEEVRKGASEPRNGGLPGRENDIPP